MHWYSYHGECVFLPLLICLQRRYIHKFLSLLKSSGTFALHSILLPVSFTNTLRWTFQIAFNLTQKQFWDEIISSDQCPLILGHDEQHICTFSWGWGYHFHSEAQTLVLETHWGSNYFSGFHFSLHFTFGTPVRLGFRFLIFETVVRVRLEFMFLGHKWDQGRDFHLWMQVS